jgi:hypothetical protein
MNNICCEIDNLLKSNQSSYVITTNECGKFGGDGENLSSDHFVNAPKIVMVYLALFYNSMLVHGMSPDSMILGTMVPIPKCKQKPLDTSDNYRSITLSSIVSKIFDIIILSKEEDLLITSDLQFGFKEGSSTTQCTFNLLETIQHYNFHHTDVHILLLDATKAFDRVEFCELFRLLLDRNLSPLVLRLLLYMYTEQCIQVKWRDKLSEAFNVKNGVKQGANLSPILFSIYIDGLLCKLRDSGIGCHVGNYYMGCLAYADDVVLLCPTRSGLQKMLDNCLEYADAYKILFNGTKSQYLVFNGRGNPKVKSHLDINGVILENVNSATYLGHKIDVQEPDSLVLDANAKFWKSFNMLMADFGHINSKLLCKLFKQNCCYYYGAPLWLLSSNGVCKINTSWRKAVRALLKIPNRTHNFMIHQLANTLPFENYLEKRFIKFVNGIIAKSKRNVTAYIMRNAMHNPMSVFRQNFSLLQQEFNFNHFITIPQYESGNDAVCNTILEMIDIRDGVISCNTLSGTDVKEFIDYLCTSCPPP